MSENRRILFVDDEEVILSCFKRLLGQQFDLDTVLGPTQALDALAVRGPYAVVVSDMRMPGMNGIELISRIKQLYPNTVSLLLSGNTESPETADAVRDGAVWRLVQKPCPHEEMVQILKESLAQYESRLPVQNFP
jgi:DNA-binding NtrC family response regulator